MGKKLVVVESPAKARTISHILGKNYRVTATFGHIYDLPPRTLGFDPKTLEPTYRPIKGKQKIIKRLKTEIKNAEEVLIASDPDREGEMIAFHIFSILQSVSRTTPYKRVRFNAITPSEIKKSISSPDVINPNLVNSQKARRLLDRIVGYKISPVLWRKFRKKGLSAGRVQSAVLKFVCDREREIENFKPETTYQIVVHFEKDGVKFKATAVDENGKILEFSTKEEAKKIAEIVKKNTSKVVSVNRRKKSVPPPPPFKTSTLQQTAHLKLKFSPSKTMKIAQKLYEGININGRHTGIITYHRTDSVRISPEAVKSVREFLAKNFGENYLPQKARTFKNPSGIQDAHECIRPVNPELTPDALQPFMTSDELKMYRLVWKQFVASQSESALDEHTDVMMKSGSVFLKADGKRELFDGWRKIAEVKAEEKELPELKKGVELKPVRVEVRKKDTKPPERYTEATLIKKMESAGVGRPSTYAPTIRVLFTRNYIRKEKGKIVPTETGMMVNDYLQKEYGRYLNERFTAQMEKDLDLVEKGKKEWKDVVRKIFNALK